MNMSDFKKYEHLANISRFMKQNQWWWLHKSAQCTLFKKIWTSVSDDPVSWKYGRFSLFPDTRNNILDAW